MLRHAIISLTENCNMRCKYCGYQDIRFINSNSLKDIDEITLKKALDFVADHSAEAYDTTISFYGGEPLLHLDLLKYAIEYMEKKNTIGHKYNYRLTTNGTLLESDALDYLVDKDITCIISLDGPVSIHDRYRVYKNGMPTYADIIKNVKRIAKKHPKYYEKNIQFNAVVSPPYNRPITKDYFDKSEAIFIDVTIGDYFSKLLKGEYGVERVENSENMSLQKVELSKDEVLKNRRYLSSLKKYLHIGEKDIRSSIFPTGFCSPLMKRIHIGVDGKLMLCERVDENNSLFHFGDVFTGYDFDKIDLLYKYTNSILEGNCNKCWAFRFCSACFAGLGKIEYNGDYCKYLRKTIEQDLMILLELRFDERRFDELMQSISID
jgi:uncharacterized protein